MNIRHITTILCNRAVIDRESNNLNAFDILEQLTIELTSKGRAQVNEKNNKKKLIIPHKFYLVSSWMRDNLKAASMAEAEVSLIDPNGANLLKKTYIPTFPSGKRRLRMISTIDGLPFTVAGIYWFVVKVTAKGSKQSKVVAEIPLEVSIT